MKCNYGGIIRDMTPEEERIWKKGQEQSQNPPKPTIDERVTVLEQDMADIKVGYAEGVNNA